MWECSEADRAGEEDEQAQGVSHLMLSLTHCVVVLRLTSVREPHRNLLEVLIVTFSAHTAITT